MPIVTLGSLLYTCYVQLQYYVSNWLDLCITCTKIYCHWSSVFV